MHIDVIEQKIEKLEKAQDLLLFLKVGKEEKDFENLVDNLLKISPYHIADIVREGQTAIDEKISRLNKKCHESLTKMVETRAKMEKRDVMYVDNILAIEGASFTVPLSQVKKILRKYPMTIQGILDML